MTRERRRRAADPRNRVAPAEPAAAHAPAPAPYAKLSPAPFIGMAGIACDFFLCGVSALIAPWWVVALLMLAWLASAVACVRWWTPHPQRLVPAAGALAAAWLVAVVVAALLRFG